MPKPTWLPVLLALLGCGAASGCISTRHQVCAASPQPAQHDIVFVVPGAGNSPRLETNLRQVIAEEHVPLSVELFDWAHGHRHYLVDQIDYENIRCKAKELAGRIATYRQLCPNAKIYLVAHSAGSAVVLMAAESLPRNTLTRIVLLAPAVSPSYDLRPGLLASEQGIDAFTSERDRWSLGLATNVVGTADRQKTTAAGRFGFQPVLDSPEDAALYEKLRQHPWDRCVVWTGNRGQHNGGCQPGFLRAYVLPLLH